MRAWAALMITLILLGGCLSLQDEEAMPGEAATPESVDGAGSDERVIIAVLDSGINPYHEEFRSPDKQDLELAPGAKPVNLTLDAESLDEAHEEDWETLMELEEGVLYGFPGTKIIGAISFLDIYGEGWPRIVDDPESFGHGTMTASRAAGNTASVPGDDPRIGLVLVQTGTALASYEWVAEQDWIDVVSLSQCPCFGMTGADQTLSPEGIEALKDVTQQKPTFLAAGNGLLSLFAGGTTVGAPTWTQGAFGVPDAISVGAIDNDQYTTWSNHDPYIAADGCASPAAAHDSMTDVPNRGGGTSGAAPTAAGASAALILEAREWLDHTATGLERDERLELPQDGWHSLAPYDHELVLARGDPGETTDGPLADGAFTLLDLKDTLYHTALEDPAEVDSDGEACVNSVVPGDVPSQAAFPLAGYGEINEESIALATDVLDGEASMPERPVADVHYERAHEKKTLLVSAGASGDGASAAPMGAPSR